MLDAPSKPCIKCHEEKPETEFYLMARGYPWRSNVCKVCHCARSLAAVNRRRSQTRGGTTP